MTSQLVFYLISEFITHLSDGGSGVGVDAGERASAWSGVAMTGAVPSPVAPRHTTGVAPSPSSYAASYCPAVDCKQHTYVNLLYNM